MTPSARTDRVFRLTVDQIASVIHPDTGWLPLQIVAALVRQLADECDCRSDSGECEHEGFLDALAEHFERAAAERKVRP